MFRNFLINKYIECHRIMKIRKNTKHCGESVCYTKVSVLSEQHTETQNHTQTYTTLTRCGLNLPRSILLPSLTAWTRYRNINQYQSGPAAGQSWNSKTRGLFRVAIPSLPSAQPRFRCLSHTSQQMAKWPRMQIGSGAKLSATHRTAPKNDSRQCNVPVELRAAKAMLWNHD
jgi:hypothetical protein